MFLDKTRKDWNVPKNLSNTVIAIPSSNPNHKEADENLGSLINANGTGN